ncbi:hypothetical protein EC988_001657 [Linderina pennispora]|nr:hypothetical protein EC988_001657 [Linderina pennispora]
MEAALRRVLAGVRSELLRQFMVVSHSSVPRLADLAARHLTRAELKTYKHNLALCLEDARPPIGRIVGPAVETSGNCVSAALKAQHLELPIGHQCAVCNQWFLLPTVEVLVWATMPLLQHRIIPFKVRLCSRNCLFTDTFVNILTK